MDEEGRHSPKIPVVRFQLLFWNRTNLVRVEFILLWSAFTMKK